MVRFLRSGAGMIATNPCHRPLSRPEIRIPSLPDQPQRSNADWLYELRATGTVRDAAIADLRAYLLRAVLIYLTRNRSDLVGFHYDELRQLAEDWTQEALVQVLANLDGFRGDSKFTTWAYRIAINLVAGELRRKRWENVSLEALTESDSPDLSLKIDDTTVTPEASLTRVQVWSAIQAVIDTDLTERQRTVLTEVVFQGVPIEVVAESLDTNRNNIYKIVHDARKKMKQSMEARGWSAEDVLAAFAGPGGS
jgi:RNA polymerase sigma-70 factor (ECF subfamily)